MIVRTQTVRFNVERVPMPKKIRLGYESDNLVERLEFVLPEVSQQQTAVLLMGGKYADAVRLEQGTDGRWGVDLTAAMVGDADIIEAYVRIDTDGGAAWNSGVMTLETRELPNVDTEVEQRFPMAVEQMLSDMAAHDARMAEHTETVEGLVLQAQTAENAAAESAEAALSSASESQRSAEASAESAARSEQEANDAAASATSAEQSAQNAQGAMENAHSYAMNASDSAEAAAESAVQSAQWAQESQTCAVQAGQSAQDALQAAERAEAARDDAGIQDGKMSEQSTWSSKGIVDRLCPRFEVSGAQVSCYPVAGYPLSVVSQVAAVQAGSGVPSPDNVRPISGYDSMALYHNDTVYEVSLGGLTYGGTYDWMTGMLTREAEALLLNGGEAWASATDGQFYAAHDRGDLATLTDDEIHCSHFVVSRDGAYQRTVDDSIAIRATRVWIYSSRLKTVEDLKAYLAANAVMLVYRLIQPPVRLGEGQNVSASEGENVFRSSTGKTTVRGRADGARLMEEWMMRLTALEQSGL